MAKSKSREEITGIRSHPSHPWHVLGFKTYPKPYICDGCEEAGFGPRYRCEKCDFDLHQACVYNEAAPVSHEYIPGSKFRFLRNVPPNLRNLNFIQRCDACRNTIKGFAFRCEKDDLNLHPCCQNLERSYQFEDVKLNLHKNVRENCMWCNNNKKTLKDGGNDDNGWSYMSECGNYHVHVACIIEMALEAWYNHNNNNQRNYACEGSNSNNILTRPRGFLSPQRCDQGRQALGRGDERSNATNLPQPLFRKLNTTAEMKARARRDDGGSNTTNLPRSLFRKLNTNTEMEARGCRDGRSNTTNLPQSLFMKLNTNMEMEVQERSDGGRNNTTKLPQSLFRKLNTNTDMEAQGRRDGGRNTSNLPQSLFMKLHTNTEMQDRGRRDRANRTNSGIDNIKPMKSATTNSSQSLALKFNAHQEIQAQGHDNGGALNKFWRVMKFIIKTIVSIVTGDSTMILASFFIDLTTSMNNL